MTIHELQVLVEVDEGEFHAHQCERAERTKTKHQEMSAAFDRLFTLGYIRLVGEEYSLSNDGNDLIMLIRRSHVLEKQ